MVNKTSVVLGTWSWGSGAVGGDQIFGNHIAKEQLQSVFNEAMSNGLNCWDTAFVYGMGASENILSSFVKTVERDTIILSTKFTPQVAGNAENPVEAMLDDSLQRLGTDYIDIYWIHNPADVERWTPYLAPLVEAGKVRKVGVSNHNLEQIKRAKEILSAEGVELSAVQNHYSLLYRSSEKAGILDYCKENGIDFWAYMVLEQGAISGKYDTKHPLPADSQRGQTYTPMMERIEKLVAVMKNIGDKYVLNPAQVALAWAIAKGTTPIIGVTGTSQITDAVKALKYGLAEADILELEKAADEAEVDTRGSWENPMI